MQLSWRSSRKDFEWCNPYFKGFWAYNGDGSLFCWCVTGSVVALGDVRALVVKHTHTHTLRLCSAAHYWSFVLLQHLASCLRQLCREETTCGEGAGSEYDGHGFGDADEWLEDADAQDGRKLAEGIQETKRCAPEHKRRGTQWSFSSWYKEEDLYGGLTKPKSTLNKNK